MDESNADLGVAIVSFNTSPLLDRCLSSLRRELDRSGIRAVVSVVDNASTDGSALMVTRQHPWVRLCALDENRGFAAGNNLVLRPWATKPDDAPRYALLLNPDTELLPGALSALVSAMDEHRDVGLAGPRLVYPDGSFQHSAFHFPGLVQTALDLFPVARFSDSRLNGRYAKEKYDRGRPFDIDMPLGACMLARTSAVAIVGLLDEGFFMYCEEVDWARRFHAGGYRVMCVPGSLVVHHAGASTSQVRAPMFTALWRSRLRCFDKHYGAARCRALRGLVRLGLATHAVRDRFLERRGSIDDTERRARRAAYAAVFSIDGP